MSTIAVGCCDTQPMLILFRYQMRFALRRVRSRCWKPKRKKSKSCDVNWPCCEIQDDVSKHTRGLDSDTLGCIWMLGIPRVSFGMLACYSQSILRWTRLRVLICPRQIGFLCSGHKVLLTEQFPPSTNKFTTGCRDLLRGEHVNEMLYAGHSKVSLAIDNTFEEALAQLSAVEAMLTSCAPRSDSPKILGADLRCFKSFQRSMVTVASWYMLLHVVTRSWTWH